MFDQKEHWISTTISPRQKQIQAIEWFLANKHKKYFFLELPVGTGKSYVGLSIAKILGQSDLATQSSYVLTPQRILQKQYEDTARSHVVSLYGKSNYECETHKTTCDIGALMQQCKTCDSCPHKSAFVAATKYKSNLVLNYALALTLFSYVPGFSKRDVVIFDECHNLEKFLVEFGSPVISTRRCKKVGIEYPSLRPAHKMIDWIKDVYQPAANKYMAQLEDVTREIVEQRSTNMSHADRIVLKEYASLEDHLIEISSLLKIAIEEPEYFSTQYVLVQDTTSLTFKPLTAHRQFQNICEQMGEKFVFMSATILDHKQFCENLGIDPEQSAFLSVDSDFPVENRPVYYLPQLKMNYKWKENINKIGRDHMITTIKEILHNHNVDSGIIHAGNFQIASWLVEQLSGSKHKIFHHNPDETKKANRNQVISDFSESDVPSLLISPSITEGLDLKDDLSRFAIIAKIPFPNMMDAWIKRRMELSNKWYQLRTITDVIQGCGRVVRSKDDWGVTYILDESWGFLYNSTNRYIPTWWKSGLN